MACFIAGFYVYKYEVILFKGLDGCLSFAFVIGICQTCSTFHLYNLQSCIVANASDEVYGRNYRARLHLRILLHECLHRRTIAATPRPDTISLTLSTLSTLLIERVSCQEFLRLQNHLIDEISSLLGRHSSIFNRRIVLCLDQERFPLFIGMIMGWGADDMLRAALDDQQMAILDTSDEFYTLASLTFIDGFSKVLIQIFDEYIGILGLKITTVVSDNLAISECDDITADGKVVVSHLVANRGCLEWTTSFVYLIQIIAKNSGISYLRSWRESLRNRNQSSTATFTSQLVHHGLMGILQ